MKDTQKDILNTQQQSEENPNNSESRLIETEVINNTPFHVVKQNEEYFITMGNRLITHKYKTKEEAIDCLEREKWFIIITMIAIVIEQQEVIKATLKGS